MDKLKKEVENKLTRDMTVSYIFFSINLGNKPLTFRVSRLKTLIAWQIKQNKQKKGGENFTVSTLR